MDDLLTFTKSQHKYVTLLKFQRDRSQVRRRIEVRDGSRLSRGNRVQRHLVSYGLGRRWVHLLPYIFDLIWVRVRGEPKLRPHHHLS